MKESKRLNNLYVCVDKHTAYKVIAIVDEKEANNIQNGAVIDVVDNMAIIVSNEEVKFSDYVWEFETYFGKLQLGHSFAYMVN